MTKTKTSHLAFLAVVGVFCVLYSYIFVVKHDYQFQTFGWDSGFYHQIIYKASLGDFGFSTIENHSLMTDHFQPLLLTVAPLMRIWSDIRILLVVQTIVAVSGVIPLYLLSLKVNRQPIFALAVSFSYLLMVSFQHAIFDGLTQTFFIAPLFGWLFYALETKRLKLFWACVIGTILLKEEFTLLLLGLGGVIFFWYSKKLGVATAIVGLASFVFLIYFLDPLVSPNFRNWAHYSSGYGVSGKNPEDVLRGIITNPLTSLSYFFDQPAKITTMKIHLLSSAFLPLLAPVSLLPVLEEYVFRFFNLVQPQKWLAHDFDFGIFLAVGMIMGARKISRKIGYKFLAALVVAAALFSDLYFHGPVNSLFKPQFYRQEPWSKNNHVVLARVPPTASVAANNTLVPHLSARKYIYQLPDYHQAEYLAVDLHNGPNDYAPIDFTRTVALIHNLLARGEYAVIFSQGDAYLLKKAK